MPLHVKYIFPHEKYFTILCAWCYNGTVSAFWEGAFSEFSGLQGTFVYIYFYRSYPPPGEDSRA